MINKNTWMGITSTGFILLTLVLFVFALSVLPYYLTQSSKQNSTELKVRLFLDDHFSVDLLDAVNNDKNDWQSIDTFNLGLNSVPHWLKFTLPTVEGKENRLLLVNYSLLDHVDVWFLTSPEQGSEVIGAYNAGDAYPYAQRVIKSDKFIFEVPSHDQALQVYIRVVSKGPVNVPLEIWSTTDFIEYSSLQKLFLGLFFGYMMAMALSNLYIYATNRNNLFLVYSAYVTCLATTMASFHGIGFRYIWPNNIWLQELSVPVFSSLTFVFIITLSINLLDLKANTPFIFKVLRSFRFIFIGLLCLSFVLPYEIIVKALLVLLVMSSAFIFISGVTVAMRGSIVARYFCGAWGVLFLSGVAISMENFGLYDSVINASYLLMVGAIIEALLLALALSININQQLLRAKKTRDLAVKNEQEAIEAKDELIGLQEQNQIELEYSIEERTYELEIALRELEEKNSELEKLSAIDPLTGLMNRRYFDKRILAECRRSRREKTHLSIAMLDIDHFKKVNDNYGHLGGDHCLKVFAETLKEVIKRPSDIICRYGGEEFVLILPNTDQEGLVKLLEKVRNSVANKKIMFESQELNITVSIGACSRVVLSDEETSMMVAFADKQLYKAKESGRNCVMVQSY